MAIAELVNPQELINLFRTLGLCPSVSLSLLGSLNYSAPISLLYFLLLRLALSLNQRRLPSCRAYSSNSNQPNLNFRQDLLWVVVVEQTVFVGAMIYVITKPTQILIPLLLPSPSPPPSLHFFTLLLHNTIFTFALKRTFLFY